MTSNSIGRGAREAFEVVVAHVDTVPVVRVIGALDLGTAPILDAKLEEFDSITKPLVIDLSDVTFIDSSGISVLIQCQERREDDENGSRVRLVVTRDAVRRVIEFTGLTETFDVYASTSEAVLGG